MIIRICMTITIFFTLWNCMMLLLGTRVQIFLRSTVKYFCGTCRPENINYSGGSWISPCEHSGGQLQHSLFVTLIDQLLHTSGGLKVQVFVTNFTSVDKTRLKKSRLRKKYIFVVWSVDHNEMKVSLLSCLSLVTVPVLIEPLVAIWSFSFFNSSNSFCLVSSSLGRFSW